MASTAASTLADVAAAAGVDVSTVSRVLNGIAEHRVSPATRDRVVDAARRLAYRPNALARALRTSRTFSLGLAVPRDPHPGLSGIVEGATRAAADHGYALVLAHHEAPARSARAAPPAPRHARLDGLLIATADDGSTPATTRLADARTPCVALSRRLRGVAHAAVFDDQAATRLATEHLLALGHRHVALLAGRPGGWGATRRIAGFAAALAGAGLGSDPRRVSATDSDVESGEAAVRALLAHRPRPTAIVAATPALAVGAMRAVRAAGLQVPADVSLVAVHDEAVADMLSPTLTTVRLPSQALGEGATRGLIDLLEGRVARVALTVAPECVVVRESSAPPGVGAKATSARAGTRLPATARAARAAR
jgi:LacI family transcriptional regulator